MPKKSFTFILLIILIFPAISLSQWTFSFDMRFIPDTCRPSMPADSLSFGTAPGATDTFDSFDIGAPPASFLPMPYFYAPGPFISSLWRDIRAPADTVVWQLRLFRFDKFDTVIILWRTADLPYTYGYLQISTDSTFSSPVDMRTTSSFIISPPSFHLAYFRFIASPSPPDTLPPYVINPFPTCGDTMVELDLDSIAADIIDDGVGVIRDSIRVTVNGIDVTSFITITPITRGFHISYYPTTSLPPLTNFTVIINAVDGVGNHMTFTCTFRTRPAPTPRFKIYGHVYDSTTLAPIESALVVLSLGPLSMSDTTDTAGYYEFDSIAPGTYGMTASAEGYWSSHVTVTVSGSDVVQDFYLLPLIVLDTICGSIRETRPADTLTFPVPGAIITVSWDTFTITITADSLGNYCIYDVPEGETLTIIVTDPRGWLYPETIYADAGTLSTPFDIRLMPIYFDISGNVWVIDDGAPTGTHVELVGVSSCTTTAGGAFSFSVIHGTYTLIISREGYYPDTFTVTVPPSISIIDTLDTIPFFNPPPPRNLAASHNIFARMVWLSWDPPLERGLAELRYDDGPVPFGYFPFAMTAYGINKYGVRFSILDSLEIVGVRAGMCGTVNAICNICSWSGTAPGMIMAADTQTSYESPTSPWVSFDFHSSPVFIEAGHDVFIQFEPIHAGDSLCVLIDILDTNLYDPYQYIYHPMVGWVNLSAATGGEASGVVFVVRIYVRYAGHFYALDVTSGGTIVSITPILDWKEVEKDFLGRSPIIPDESTPTFLRTLELSYPSKYRIYRSFSLFDSVTAPGVTRIAEVGWDTTYYYDRDVLPDTNYYYRVTAVYPGGSESEVSNFAIGRCVEYAPAARILIVDHDDGLMLADSGTAPEDSVLAAMLDSIVTGITPGDIYISHQNEILQHFILVDTLTGLPRYEAVFIISSPHNFRFGDRDLQELMSYLRSGGKLYIEGADVGYFLDGTDFLDSLGVSFADDGSDSFNVLFLRTADTAFFEWQKFTIGYSFGTTADLTNDELEPIAGTGAKVLMYSWGDTTTTTDSVARVIYYDSGTYKAITSSIYLGAMIDGEFPATRIRILGSILNAFGIANTRVETKLKPEYKAILTSFPNPFNSSTTIEFTLPEELETRISIIDVVGNKVYDAYLGKLYPGTHRIIWNGVTSDGHDVPSGIYFARLFGDGKIIASGRIILLR